jgi:cell division protein FtsB
MRTCPCMKMLAHLASVPSPVETTMNLESLRAENNALRARMRELEDELQRLQGTAHTGPSFFW